MDTYVPSNVIVHETSVFFESRNVAAPIHIVQYDDQLPVVAVSLFKGDNGSEEYVLPSGAIANLRYVRPDGGVAYNAALGKSADSKIVYFEVTQIMAMYCGKARAVVEIDISGKVACSSPITFEIDRNPVQEGQIEATDEFTAVTQYAEMAREAAESISGMTADAEASVPGSDADVTVSGGTGPSDPYHLHFVLPRGEAGPSGNAAVIAPEYSASSPYNVGDIVIQNNLLYICTTPIPSGETWNVNHWQLTTMGEQMEKKANTDGSYVTLRAGSADTADQLYSNTYITDDEPYIFRTSGGSADIADRESLELEGNTVGWNQQFPNGDFHEASGYSLNRCTMAVSNNIGEFTCNSTAYASYSFYRSMPYTAGHKYFVCLSAKCATTNAPQQMAVNASSSSLQAVRKQQDNPAQDTWYYLYAFISCINTASVGTSCALSYAANQITSGDKIYAKNFMFIDLTLLYGSDIADKIYALEQATSGAGVAWLIKRFPKLDGGYYAYHAPSLESVCVDRHVMNRFNQWDEEWEVGSIKYATGENVNTITNNIRSTYVQVFPSFTYYIKSPTTNRLLIWGYDINKNPVSRIMYNYGNTTFDIPNSVYFVRFATDDNYGSTYKHDICINLHWDGERDGEYEANEEFSYAMGHDELRGIPEAEMVTPEGSSTPVWTGNLVYNGDTKTPDGKIRRRVKEYVLNGNTPQSDIAVSVNSTYGYTNVVYIPYASEGIKNTKFISNRFVFVQASDADTKVGDIRNSPSAPRMWLYLPTTVTTKAEAIAWFASNPTTICALIATPIIEDADPYMDPQNVDNWGTERFVDYHVEQGDRDVEIFVGHTTKYPPDLKAKLEMAPESPPEDGDYFVRQTSDPNVKNQYVSMNALYSTIDNKADKVGEFDGLTAGSSKAILSNTKIIEKDPYAGLRTTAGNEDVTNRKEETIIGGTWNWNQLIEHGNFDVATGHGWGFSGSTGSVSNNKCTITTKVDNTSSACYRTFASDVPAGHVIFIQMIVTPSINTQNTRLRVSKGSGTTIAWSSKYPCTANKRETVSAILAPTDDWDRIWYYVSYGDSPSSGGTTFVVENCMCIDLTLLCGPDIANYINTLETNTPGDGVKWLYKYFPKLNGGYYKYCVPTLESVRISLHQTFGFNQMLDDGGYDPESGVPYEYFEAGDIDTTTGEGTTSTTKSRTMDWITVFPGEKYYLGTQDGEGTGTCRVFYYGVYMNASVGRTYIGYEDVDMNDVLTIPSNCYAISLVYNAAVATVNTWHWCMNIHYDGERDGDYKPPVGHGYSMGGNNPPVLRGIPKLDLYNNLYYDGDIWTSDGNVKRKYGIIDLGSISWTRSESGGNYLFASSITGKANGKTNFVCSKYAKGNPSVNVWTINDKEIMGASTSATIYVKDNSYTDKDTFKAAMSGVYLVYLLATPTTESYAGFDSQMIVDNWGTEYFADADYDYAGDGTKRDVEIPVGHETVYHPDLVDKLEMVPTNPGDDGTYVLKVEDGEAGYSVLEIPNELPTAPSSNGNYKLRCVVSDGTATYSWVADT